MPSGHGRFSISTKTFPFTSGRNPTAIAGPPNEDFSALPTRRVEKLINNGSHSSNVSTFENRIETPCMKNPLVGIPKVSQSPFRCSRFLTAGLTSTKILPKFLPDCVKISARPENRSSRRKNETDELCTRDTIETTPFRSAGLRAVAPWRCLRGKTSARGFKFPFYFPFRESQKRQNRRIFHIFQLNF